MEPVLDIELVEIPGGPFSMGLTASQANELKRESYTVTPAKPVRTVVVGNFSISRYPITNAQYAEFVAATGTAPPRHWKGMAPPAAIRDHPVVWVSHARARQYCEWLAMRTDMPYRLPTSEEWEKAARGAADQRRFPWGETLDPSRCAYRKRKTVPVHAFSPQGDSPYYVADLVGNAREWTRTTIAQRWGSETAVVRGGGIIARRDFELWCAYLTERSTNSAATIGFRVALG